MSTHAGLGTVTAAFFLAAALVGCAAPSASSSSSSGSAANLASARPSGMASARVRTPAAMFGTVFRNPRLTAADGALYLRWDRTPADPGQPYPPSQDLARVDPATGRVVAVNWTIPGSAGAPMAAAGKLWVIDSASDGEILLRLDPATLTVTGRVKIAGGSYPADPPVSSSHLAYAAGTIWADGRGVLTQMSPSSMTVRRVITLPHTDSSDIAASPDGSTLIVSEADMGNGTIQRRDPATGALLDSAGHILGVVAPILEGVTGDGLWIAEPTGMLGYIERFTTPALAGQATTQVEGTNGIKADPWDGVLWVTDTPGGQRRNYCADPATGVRLAALRLPELGQDQVQVVTGGRIYYSVPAGSGFAIRTVPVPAACR